MASRSMYQESSPVTLALEESGSGKAVAYVTAKFPAESLVFQQNEMLGLKAAGADLRIFSCRKVTSGAARHGFLEPLMEDVRYPSVSGIARGALHCLRHPVRTLRLMGQVLVGALNPAGMPRILAAAAVAVGAVPRLQRRKKLWIHADFGKHTATVAYFIAILTGHPFSFKVHAFDIFRTDLRNRDPLESRKVKAAARVLSEHSFGAREYESRHPCLAGSVRVHYSCVRTSEFLPTEVGARIPPTFVAIGRLVPKKGFDVLLRSFARARRGGFEGRLLILGDGPERDALEDLVRENGLTEVVSLHGAFLNDDLPKLVWGAVALVAPSIREPNGDIDGVPTVIYEALSLGLPVIASRIAGIPEVIKTDVNGILVEAGDEEGFSLAMTELAGDLLRARDMGQCARATAEQHYDLFPAGRKLLDIFSTPRTL